MLLFLHIPARICIKRGLCYMTLLIFQVRDLDNNAQRLMQTHPDQAESIYEHQTEINEMWNSLTIKVSLFFFFLSEV